MKENDLTREERMALAIIRIANEFDVELTANELEKILKILGVELAEYD